MNGADGDRAVDLTAGLTPLRVAGYTVGWLHPAWRERALQAPTPFRWHNDALTVVATIETFASRSAALAQWGESARERWQLPGWRNERVVIRDARASPLFGIERALLRPLGLQLRSAQASVWSMTVAGPLIWIARRSASKPVEPGKLDALVAGGIAGLDAALPTLIRECQEEAGIPEVLARLASPAGELNMAYAADYDGLPVLHRERIALFDLELPPYFMPVVNDGEHEAIVPMTPGEALSSIREGGWTREGAQATIDLIRRKGWSAGVR